MKVNGVVMDEGLVIEADNALEMAGIEIVIKDARLERGSRKYTLTFSRTGIMRVDADDAVRVSMGNMAVLPESANVVMIKPL